MKCLDDVAIFTKVVEARSFTKGAKLLGMAKPSVSRRVAQLEEALGVRLLQRTTRKLELTEEGKAFFESCIPGIEVIQDSIQALTEAQAEPTGLLRIAAPIAFSAAFLSHSVAEFCALYPKVQIELITTDQDIDLIASRIDLAFHIGTLSDSSLIGRKFSSAPRVLVASPEYLKNRKLPQHPDDLKEHRCLIFGSASSRHYWEFSHNGRSDKVKIDGYLFSNSKNLLLQWSLAGAGISIQPMGLAAKDLKSGRLLNLLDEYTLPTADISAVYPSRHQLSINVKSFLKFIQPKSSDWSTIKT